MNDKEKEWTATFSEGVCVLKLFVLLFVDETEGELRVVFDSVERQTERLVHSRLHDLRQRQHVATEKYKIYNHKPQNKSKPVSTQETLFIILFYFISFVSQLT